MKFLRTDKVEQSISIKNDKGELLTYREVIMERWIQYHQNLLATNDQNWDRNESIAGETEQQQNEEETNDIT